MQDLAHKSPHMNICWINVERIRPQTQAQLTLKPHALSTHDTTRPSVACRVIKSICDREPALTEKASPGQTKLKTGESVTCVGPAWSRSEDSNPGMWMIWFLKSAFSTTIEKVEISTFYFVEIVLLKESRCQPAKAIGSIWYREK